MRKVNLKEGGNIFPVYLFIAMLMKGESITCSLFTRAFIWASNIKCIASIAQRRVLWFIGSAKM